MGDVKYEQMELDLGIRSYLIEVSTQIPVTVNSHDVTNDVSLHDMITSKAVSVMGDMDMNLRPFTLKVLAESKDNE